MTEEKRHSDIAGGNESAEPLDEGAEERAFIARMLRGLGTIGTEDKQAVLETVFALRLLQAFRGAGALLVEEVAAVVQGAPVMREGLIGADWTVAPFGFLDTRTGQRYDFRVQLLVTAHRISDEEAEARTGKLEP